MTTYQTILLAVDLTDESEPVADRAVSLARADQATLHVIHVIEPINFAYGGDIPMDLSTIQDQLNEHAANKMKTLCEKHSISEDCIHVVVGFPNTMIHSVAEEISADLIVVGSHGRHGLALLLGSTANGVLHGASCDVLAVRVGDDS